MNLAGDVILEARGITKIFPGVTALENVDLVLRPGRLTALLGENGAGKSTLMNIIAGVFPPDAGQVFLDGREVHFTGPRDAQDLGIAMIFQELNLVPHLSVAENIFLGREPLNRLGLIDRALMNRNAAEILARLDLAVSPTATVESLRVGQQQVVEIAKALAGDARILIMDEPTSALTEHEIEALFRIIAALKNNGVAIAYITHKFEELKRIGDDAVVMRDGKLIAAAPLKDLRHEEIVAMMVGRDINNLYQRPPAKAGENAREALRVKGLSLKRPGRRGGGGGGKEGSADFILRDIDLAVNQGQVLGIFGLMGAGRTELLETIFGLHAPACTGEIFVDEKSVRIRSPREAIALGVALAPEDRKREGLVLEMTVAQNTSLASLAGMTRWGFIDEHEEIKRTQQAIRQFRVKTPSPRTPIVSLSGGNQQKVILAKWLATRPKILLLDEPTRGIDINAKREIYGLIDELKATGLAVLMVSSELPEIMAVADRIMVMCEGRKTADFSRADATEQSIMTAALPQNNSREKISP